MPEIRRRLAVSRVWLPLLMIALLFFLGGAGCTREPLAPLRVGTSVWPGYEPLYLARDQGFISSSSVRLVEFTSASETLRAFRNGAIDVAALTFDEALILAETSADFSVILVLDVSNGGDVILAHPPILKLRELKGKRVGLETTALGAYMLTRALQTVGLKPKDVRITPLDVLEQERAFKEKRIDAVVTYEPVRTKLLAAGARQLFDSSKIPGEIIDILIVRRSPPGAEEERRAEQISHLVRRWFKALDFIQKDQRRAAALMAPREKLSPDEFQRALNGMRFPDREGNAVMFLDPSASFITNAQRLARVMVANRLLEREPEVKNLFDSRFVKDAARP